ncbi:MAG: serine hydrolase domain-containing protein [Dissulfurimicrobium sp.]|uniref:serine hydrolase domain-containing protein n=1 Tax=Dissulfurimicrobium TaxID=1769732 RepID=UPI001EDACADD|nr:serine hydrolase [Dissulfurimicrobium hydrothermale]UKL14406.1 serine hydrolase [Dissulfurimicrobium hydrothermale]
MKPHKSIGLAGAFIEEAIEDGLFPGCTLSIRYGGLDLDLAFGRLAYAPWVARVTVDTVYDLASLTKPLATALAVLALVTEGRMRLDSSLDDLLPSVPDDKRSITVSMLLSHSSGLPAHRPYYNRLVTLPLEERRGALLDMILSEPLECVKRPIYSDLGFMLLGFIVEDIMAMPLNEAVHRLVFMPFDARQLWFSGEDLMPLHDFAPSAGFCGLRKRVLWGEVNDQNAWALGGIAGHAGLFGTASCIKAMLSRLLSLYKGESIVPGFTSGLVRKAFTPCCGTWGLGFDTPSVYGSTSGRFFSKNSVGHLGFTGTSFWMDLDQGVIVVFLSNRTFPHHAEAKQEEMRRFRARLHDAIMTTL